MKIYVLMCFKNAVYRFWFSVQLMRNAKTFLFDTSREKLSSQLLVFLTKLEVTVAVNSPSLDTFP